MNMRQLHQFSSALVNFQHDSARLLTLAREIFESEPKEVVETKLKENSDFLLNLLESLNNRLAELADIFQSK